MASVLGADQLELQQVSTTLDVKTHENEIHVNSASVHSDVANLEITGSTEFAEWMTASSLFTQLLAWKSSHQFHISGNVDVAALAAQLPETLQIRDGTRISRGTVTLDVASRIELGQRLVDGTLQTDRIAATAAGRNVSWDRPLHLALSVLSAETGVQIQEFTCQSDFLELTAAGSLENGRFHGEGNLDQLANQLGQFLDLGDLQMTGQLQADGNWQQQNADRSTATVTAEVARFAITSSEITPIRESLLKIVGQASGLVGNDGLQRLDSANLHIVSGEDQLMAKLTAPVSQPQAGTVWPLTCQLSGHTETWLARLQPWIELGDWDVKAGIQADVAGTFDSGGVKLNPCQLDLSQVSVTGPGWLIREPRIQIQGAIDWDAATNQVAAPALTLSSSTLAARGENLRIQLAESDATASGTLAFRGDLQRLWHWQYAAEPPTWQPLGQLEGQVQLTTSAGVVAWETSTTIANFVYQTRTAPLINSSGPSGDWENTWSEPLLRIVGSGTYQPNSDRLELVQCDVSGEGLGLTAGGNLTQLTAATPVADLQGELRYDLNLLALKLRSTLGPEVRVTGQRKTPLTLRGPLVASSVSLPTSGLGAGSVASSGQVVPTDLAMETSIGWDNLEAYGFAVGPQNVTTRLHQGTLFFSPIETSIAQGGIKIAPRIELNAHPMMVAVDQGVVAEGIQITPEMFTSWFRYIAPILAGSATAEGKLSVALQGARIPFSDPMTGTAAGKITIDGARVQAGPMAQQLMGTVNEIAVLLKQAAPSLNFLSEGQNWLELPPQDVDFQMTQGRVYHRNIELSSGSVVIRTQGWVGVDQSLGMLAEIPVQDKWIGSDRTLAALQGQTIQIPIQGSLSKPQLDQRAVAQLSQQLIGQTAERLLQNELQKGLKKLLGPK